MTSTQGTLSSNYRNVARAFDRVSGIFDTELENEITRHLRKKIYRTIERILPSGSSVLDINCGTGIDAIQLASVGYRVVGIDISRKMIEQAQSKIKNLRRNKPRFLVGSYDRLPSHVEGLFDLVLSNFGGLNCTDNLSLVAKQISVVLKPGGFFVGVVMPRFSLWETCSYLFRGDLGNAVRRLRKSTFATGFQEETFSVYYHSPSKFTKAFAPWFETEELMGLCICSPSPQSTNCGRTYPKLMRWLERLDSAIEKFPVFRSIGDHYALLLRGKS